MKRLLVTALFLAGCNTLPQPDLGALSKGGMLPGGAGAQAEALTAFLGVPDEAGRLLDERRVAGKVVLLDFWATWCQPCQFSTPFYRRLHLRFVPKGLVVVGVNVDDDHGAMLDYLKVHPLPFAMVWDKEKALSTRYGVMQLPTSFLFDRKGRLRKTRIGYDPEDERQVEDEVRLLLGESP